MILIQSLYLKARIRCCTGVVKKTRYGDQDNTILAVLFVACLVIMLINLLCRGWFILYFTQCAVMCFITPTALYYSLIMLISLLHLCYGCAFYCTYVMYIAYAAGHSLKNRTLTIKYRA